MVTQSIDTDPKVEQQLISLLRKIPFSKKFDRMQVFSSTVINLSKRAIARANPNLSKQEKDILFVKYNYSAQLAANLKKHFDNTAT